MTDEEFKAVHIAEYRADQKKDSEAIAWIDAGGRHFDQGPGAGWMVDSTDKVRAERLAHIEMLEGLVRLWATASSSFSGSTASGTMSSPVAVARRST